LLFVVFREPLALASPAVGVGSKDPYSVPLMRGSQVGSSDTIPRRIIPERGKVSKDAIEAPGSERGDVFNEDEARLDLFDDSPHLGP